VGRYLTDLEQRGRLPAETASIEKLRAALARAEEALLQGDARAATSDLFALVEAPRFAGFREHEAFQSAEYQLGRALLRGRAFQAAELYLRRVLAHGPRGLMFVPTHRALVDLALERRDYGRVLTALEAAAPDGPALPADAAHERAYLRGRVAYDRKAFDQAMRHFGEIGRTSRLYAGAAYFRGLIAAQEGALRSARGAFCEIVGRGKPGEPATLRFLIDGRFFMLRDLAHLALGRVAHEQDRYDEAYYHYFSVPSDSERLAEALYEAAWSLYQKGEHAVARAFVDDHDRLFPHSPRRPEVQVLRANLALKACNFDGARVEIAALERTYAPAQEMASRAAGDAERRRALVGRLLGATNLGPTSDEDGSLLSLLRLDGRIAELASMLRDLDADVADARLAVAAWRELGETLRRKGGAQGLSVAHAASSAEAAALLDEVAALVPLTEGDPALAERVSGVLLDATLAAYPALPSAPYAPEELRAAEVGRRAVALRKDLHGAADALVLEALRDLDARLRAILRQGRLVRIDAVVGRKKRLELDIANIYAGRLPASLYTHLKVDGTIGDDEEYWPFEGEYWADEYEK
jgi:tetratricopeptide (TPR) repeat protein